MNVLKCKIRKKQYTLNYKIWDLLIFYTGDFGYSFLWVGNISNLTLFIEMYEFLVLNTK